VQQPTDDLLLIREVAMDDRQLNPLKTGMLFVAPGQIMDPGIVKLPHHPDHLSRLKADVGLDALEAELAGVPEPDWSIRHWLERIGEFVGHRWPPCSEGRSKSMPGQVT
jgi:hypothetical protein